jgi:U3 small nucleolar RNA-associated protein 13
MKDYTEQDTQEAIALKQAVALDTHQLQNFIKLGQWEMAVKLAIKMNRKNDLRLTFVAMLHTLGEMIGHARLDNMVARWDEKELQQVLSHCRDWSTHSQYCLVAQTVLNAICRMVPPEILIDNDAIVDVLEPILAYSDRHFARLTGLLQKTFLLDLSLSELRPLNVLLPEDITYFIGVISDAKLSKMNGAVNTETKHRDMSDDSNH